MKVHCDDEYTQKFFSHISKKINRFHRSGDSDEDITIPPLYEWLFYKDKRLISTPEYSVNEVIIKFGNKNSLMTRYLWLDKYNAPNESLHELLWDDEFPEDIQNVVDYMLNRQHLPIAESYIRYLWKKNKELGEALQHKN
jgi:hypothetical protein